MASLGVRIDPTEHDTDTQRGTASNIPDGTYRLEVEDADVKKDGEGTQRKIGLNTTIAVIEPEEFKGRKIFTYFNLEHPTAEAQRIGQADFAKLCRALGISSPPDDSDELKFIAFTADIGLGKPSKTKNQDGTPQYPAKNEIKKYYYPDEGDVPAPKAKPVAANDNAGKASTKPAANDNGARSTGNGGSAPTARAASGGKTPWGKKAAA